MLGRFLWVISVSFLWLLEESSDSRTKRICIEVRHLLAETYSCPDFLAKRRRFVGLSTRHIRITFPDFSGLIMTLNEFDDGWNLERDVCCTCGKLVGEEFTYTTNGGAGVPSWILRHEQYFHCFACSRKAMDLCVSHDEECQTAFEIVLGVNYLKLVLESFFLRGLGGNILIGFWKAFRSS